MLSQIKCKLLSLATQALHNSFLRPRLPHPGHALCSWSPNSPGDCHPDLCSCSRPLHPTPSSPPGHGLSGPQPTPSPPRLPGVVSRVWNRQWTARQARRDGQTRDPLSLSSYYFLPAALSFLDAPGLPYWTRAWGSGQFVSLLWRAQDKANDKHGDHALCAKHGLSMLQCPPLSPRIPIKCGSRSACQRRVRSSLRSHTELQKQDSSPICRTPEPMSWGAAPSQRPPLAHSASMRRSPSARSTMGGVGSWWDPNRQVSALEELIGSQVWQKARTPFTGGSTGHRPGI